MKLNRLEKKTFFLLMIAGFFNGFVIGSFQIQDIIAKKALHALDWQITILIMLWPISNLFSIWWGKILEQSKSLSKYFVIIAFAGRLILILMLFVFNYYQYLFVLILLFSFNALLIPAQNSIFQLNIRPQNRGVLFGYTASLITLVVVIANYSAGRLLDINEEWFRHIFVFVGIMGCISSLIMAMIKAEKKNFPSQSGHINLWKIGIHPIKRTLEVLKKDRNYAIFQRNFFIYGMGFLIVTPVIPKYLVEMLQMDYTHSFLAKAVITQLPILFLAPLAGKYFDKMNPAYFASIVFALLSVYPLTLIFSSLFIGNIMAHYLTYFAFLIYGIAMSGILITWNIGSMYFAGDQDAAMYQSVHVTLTGIRGLIVPFIGYLIMNFWGIRIVFAVSIILLLTASLLSFRLYLKMDQKKYYLNKKAAKMFGQFRKLLPFGGWLIYIL